MKKSPFLLLFYLVACTVSAPPSNKDTSKQVFSAQLGGWITPDSTGLIFIKTTLYNNSTDTLTYLRMDCSWADSYTTDNDSFIIIKTLCYKNGPLTMKLLPQESADEYIRILTKKNIRDWRNSTFRIGYNFNLLDTAKDISYNVSRLTDMQHILWSDTLKLSDFWKE